MRPSIGRIVLYTLTADDAAAINRRRTTGEAIAERTKTRITDESGNSTSAWPVGAQAHIGTPVKDGDIFPMIVTRVAEDEADSYECVISGQVFLDGNDTFWAQDKYGAATSEPGYCHWPPRV